MLRPTQKHEATPLVTPDGDEVLIDNAIVPLIRGMWARGWVTFNSCEGEPSERVWIEMVWPDAEEFLTLVARQAGDEWLQHNAAEPVPGGMTDYPLHPDEWEIAAYAIDCGNERHPDVMITVGVRFPKHRLPEITRIVCGELSTARARERRARQRRLHFRGRSPAA